MTAEALMVLFMKTGLPECYALYRLQKQTEEKQHATQAELSA